MEKKNSKAVVICITFVIIALAAGIFIGWTMGKSRNTSETDTPAVSESFDESESQSVPESESQTESETEPETPSETDSENTEVVVTVGDSKVDMKEINYRLYSLRNYYIQAYGEEPWNEPIDESGVTVAEAAKNQLNDDIVRTEILVDKAADYGVEATEDIKKACKADAQQLIDGLGEDICREFGLTLEGVERVYLKREISTQVMTAINDKIREELLEDEANKALDDAELEIKISEGYEAKYQEMKKSYTISYADIWDNIVVGSVG